ncbi:hypothetical protein F1_00046 [Ralstonia phage Heva]|uniref:Uncharacterized protein n=2 Tax=Cimandefvirus TaxID=2843366 RepID=A0A7G5BAT6_9CAUD|nr:hypothetical protein KMC44_gp43 [Ralstonia phage Cimandef]YP_010078516.1 hypothetical protein KMC48_gp44 [Ralstonia phage Heva]QMV32672.1 hypothetical protein B2_00038 [Ralstonia phage Cimandef]QMV33409.1 hypothetical protein F1_00046 [Ralstonia phage Heva]
MKVLKTILEQYRNGERGLPTYEELAAIVGSDHDGHAQINGAQADVRPVGWRPAFPSHRGDFTRGVPSDATVEHLRAQGVEIEYAYSRPATSEAARAEELRHALSIAIRHELIEAARHLAIARTPTIDDIARMKTALEAFMSNFLEEPVRVVFDNTKAQQQEGGKLDVSFVGGAQPTHFCKVCNAMWRRWPDGSWNLRSKQCGACCDNVEMGDQIVPMGHDGARATDGSAEAISEALRPLANDWEPEPKA